MQSSIAPGRRQISPGLARLKAEAEQRQAERRAVPVVVPGRVRQRQLAVWWSSSQPADSAWRAFQGGVRLGRWVVHVLGRFRIVVGKVGTDA